MTHCEGYRAAAVGRASVCAAIGVDGEPHAPLPDGVLEAISLPAERERVGRLTVDCPSVCWDRLLFSAKESVYNDATLRISGGYWLARPTTPSSSRTGVSGLAGCGSPELEGVGLDIEGHRLVNSTAGSRLVARWAMRI